MKIAIDGSLLHGNFSGVERAILGLATGLAHVCNDDTVLLYVGRKFQNEQLPAGRLKLRRAGGAGRSRLRRILWQQAALPLYLKAERVDVFHGPGYVLPLITSVPAVVSIYDIIALTHPHLCTRANVAHYRRVVPRSIRKARLVIVPTQAVARQLAATLATPAEKIRVVPLGIDPIFKPAPEADRRDIRDVLGLHEKFVLFVGNLEPKKNLVSLVQAFFAARMNKDLPHKLVLAGEMGWKSNPLRRIIDELDLHEHVVLPGYVPLEHLPALYSAADMFVFPSLVEGFGIPPLEAMACGTPVIVSNDPALQESAGDAAIRAEATDVAGLRKAIEMLASDEALRASLIEKGRAQAAQFTWRKTALATMAVYREAAGRTQSSEPHT